MAKQIENADSSEATRNNLAICLRLRNLNRIEFDSNSDGKQKQTATNCKDKRRNLLKCSEKGEKKPETDLEEKQDTKTGEMRNYLHRYCALPCQRKITPRTRNPHRGFQCQSIQEKHSPESPLTTAADLLTVASCTTTGTARTQTIQLRNCVTSGTILLRILSAQLSRTLSTSSALAQSSRFHFDLTSGSLRTHVRITFGALCDTPNESNKSAV